jgi:hypothetical protein
MWHVECGDGIVFPFSRGCSFITLSEDGTKIQTVRNVLFQGWLMCRGWMFVAQAQAQQQPQRSQRHRSWACFLRG